MAKNQCVPNELLKRNLFKGKEWMVPWDGDGDGDGGAVCPDDFFDESVVELGMHSEADVDLIVDL